MSGSDSGVPWRRIFDQATAAMAVLDLQGGFLYVNEALCRLLGYQRDQLLGLSYRDVTHPDDADVVRDALPGGPEDALTEGRFVRADGSVVWALLSCSRITDPTVSTQYFLAQFQDITARREAELLWQRSFSHAPIGMALLDLKGRWTAVNDTLCDLLGYTRVELLSMSFADVTYAEDKRQGAAALDDLIKGRQVSVSLEKRYRHRAGYPIWMLISATVIPGADGSPAFIVSQYEEIGEPRMVDAHLAHLALHDPLTGLANRALLADRLDHALQQLTRVPGVLAVIVADLDELKPVNDRYGHAVGDQLLITAASQLARTVRSADTVARVGGDEFVVVSLLPDEGAAGGLRDRIATYLDTEIAVFGATIHLRASVGLATTKDPETSPESLLHAADLDMYSSKSRNRPDRGA
jgi:diguanylate cyclase (GGDEF)-like protein/PAS domain S-box-containing protein